MSKAVITETGGDQGRNPKDALLGEIGGHITRLIPEAIKLAAESGKAAGESWNYSIPEDTEADGDRWSQLPYMAIRGHESFTDGAQRWLLVYTFQRSLEGEGEMLTVYKVSFPRSVQTASEVSFAIFSPDELKVLNDEFDAASIDIARRASDAGRPFEMFVDPAVITNYEDFLRGFDGRMEEQFSEQKAELTQLTELNNVLTNAQPVTGVEPARSFSRLWPDRFDQLAGAARAHKVLRSLVADSLPAAHGDLAYELGLQE